MMYKYILVLILGVIILTGCTKENSTAPVTLTDQSVIKQQVTEIDSIADFSSSDEATINDDSVQEWNTDGMGKVLSPINPILWGRKIDNIQRKVDVSIEGDSIATAVIIKIISGRLIVLATYPDSNMPTTFQKQFTQEVRREVKFRRIARNEDISKNWKPIAITTVVGKTIVRNFDITEIIIYTPNDTITISDSLMHWFWFREPRELPIRIPILNAGDSVRIRVKIISENSNNEYVMIRHCVDHRFTKRYRLRMDVVDSTQHQGLYERQYERRFKVRLPMGVIMSRYNAIVDVFSYESLNDDTAPYMNEFVGIPYIVVK